MMWQNLRPANEADESPGFSARDWLLAILLVAVTFIAYLPAWHGGFIWDDDAHVTRPGLRSLSGLVRIWTELRATQQYYPLVHSAFWVEHKLWGDATMGYHCVNILLHAFSALLLVKILRQLSIPGAWLAAALFALHPVEVESVAWITELKNTLSGVFYLGAALAYLGFDRNRGGRNYAIALGLFLLGLMSKTVIASLPAALLVVFWWQRGKLSWKRDVLPLVPFFIAGIGTGLFTAWVERKLGGAEGAEFNFSVIERCLIAGRAVWFYLGKLFWPVDLAFIYPRWNVSQGVAWQYLFPAAAVLLFGVLVWRRWRGALAALLFFAGTLFPALGFFNVYPFQFSFVADHFQYLASLGPLILAAAAVTALPGFFRNGKPFLEPVLCAALLLVLGTLTWRQCGMYANAETVWLKTIRLNPDCWMARNNLGLVFFQQGRMAEAIWQFKKTLEIKPGYAEAHNNLGMLLSAQGKEDEAILQLRAALKYRPQFDQPHYNLGLIYLHQGRLNEAIAEFRAAIKINPSYDKALANLGMALAQQGHFDEAIEYYREALAIAPDNPQAHNALGRALEIGNKLAGAAAEYSAAVVLKPDFAEARENLGAVLTLEGNFAQAEEQFAQALKLQPASASIHYNLGNALVRENKLSAAADQFAEAARLQPDYLEAHFNLALTLGQLGQKAGAIEHYRKALDLATARHSDLAQKIQARLQLYQSARP